MCAVPLLLGHRGARVRGVVENTIAAFDWALQHGCDGFEFDVRLTRDRSAIICHNARSRGRAISRSAAAQLSHLMCLDDLLAGYAARAFLDIELKVPGLETLLLAAVHENLPKRGYVVSSFLPEILSELRKQDAALPLGFICDKKKQLPLWRELPVEYIIPHYSLVTRDLINEVVNAEKKLLTWTVNNRRSMLRLAAWGVHGIISDRPELLVSTLKTGESIRG
jgi:glycerophosphoryl diester phosphodiesterase